MIYAVKPGTVQPGSRPPAARGYSEGLANIAREYATKRYRSNVMNWGMIPFLMDKEPEFEVGDYIYIPDIKKILNGDLTDIRAYVIKDEVQETGSTSLI